MAGVQDPVATSRRWAEFYAERGFQALPSDPRPESEGGRKKPLCRFAELWEKRADEDLFAIWPTTNIQVMTGRHWRLLVIDLDGPEAIDRWPSMGRCPRTWVTGTGGGGRHLWFTLPDGLPPMPKALLWGVWDSAARDGKGDWKRRMAIERLCDKSLVMAPPSVHPKTGKVYRFFPGCSPREFARPAMVPDWILRLPELHAPRPVVPEAETRRKAPVVAVAGRVDADAVLDAIPSKIAVARSWGLRFAAHSSASQGWVSVHDFNREDRNPSARFQVDRGLFWRPGERPISLFSLGVAMGAYASFRECLHALAAEYHVTAA